MLLVFLIFTHDDSPIQRELHHTAFCMFENSLWEFAVAVCNETLLCLYAAIICRRNLSWEFALALCDRFFLYLWANPFDVLTNFVYMEVNIFFMLAKLFYLRFFGRLNRYIGLQNSLASALESKNIFFYI